MLQLATKEVIRSYSTYVNNFTAAISVLEQGLKKKVKFISFLKEKYKQSNTSLSLQGLLLKPIQRFPQYIMFIQVRTCRCSVHGMAKCISSGCLNIIMVRHPPNNPVAE